VPRLRSRNHSLPFQVAAVCYRRRESSVDFLLVNTNGSGKWTFPKGSPGSQISHSHAAEREALEEAGLVEVPPLEDKLNLLATIAQITPLMGLLGTVLGFIQIFTELQQKSTLASMQDLSGGIWQALICTAAGLAVAIPCYAAYNYLVSRVNAIVLDMEKAATEIISIVSELPAKTP